MKPYFDSPSPRVLAHRGLATTAPENTALAFAHALAAGAHYIETDVHVSSDGQAIVSHDPDLERLTGEKRKVSELTAAQLAAIDLGERQGFITLAEALDGFPDARFNIDLKDLGSIAPAVAAITATRSIDRVLVTSFDERRRLAAVGQLPGVATSASARRFAGALLSGRLGATGLLRRALRDIDAVQIPERAAGLSTTSPAFIDRFHEVGVEVHMWTINDPARMVELVERGVDGIVTDRADLAVSQLRRYTITENPL